MLLVRDVMSREVTTLGPEASIQEALTLCQERRIRHVPILEEGRLVGIVSDRDLKDASPVPCEPGREGALERVRVGDVMSRDLVTCRPQDPIEHAAREMYQRKIDALPVMSEEPTASTAIEPTASVEQELMGIVTSTDVMRSLVMLAGVPEAGSRIEVQAPDRPGILAEVANAIHSSGEDIVSVLSSPKKRAEYRTLIFMLATTDPSAVVEGLERMGYAAFWMPAPTRGHR